MSIIRFGCDSCGHPIEVTEDLVGAMAKCPACSDEILVPSGPKKTWKLKLLNHKFLVTLIGCTLICTSLLMLYKPPESGNENGGTSKVKGTAPVTQEMLQRWHEQADGALADLATNQTGFERVIRSVCFANSSDDPNNWSGFTDIELNTRHGTRDHTNMMVRFALVNGLDGKSNVVCFMDSFAMEKRQYEAELETLRARQRGKTIGAGASAPPPAKWKVN